MKWLIINTDYYAFLRSFYAREPALRDAPYESQLRARYATRFGTADFYSHNLLELGHEASDIFANNEFLQKRWAQDHGVRYTPSAHWGLRWRRGLVPWPRRRYNQKWIYEILEAQVKASRPDVLYCLAIETVGSDFLRRVKGHYHLAVAQHAAMVPPLDTSAYDLVVSSLPNLVDHFRAHGMHSEFLPLGFEARVLQDLNGTPRSEDVVFVGGLSGVQHDPGARLLETLCAHFDIGIWGYGAEGLPARSPLRERYRGPLWGRDMFKAFRAAKIVLNRHGPIALDYANNMRLFEATGVGSLLLTDQRKNLGQFFEAGREVAAYGSASECVELIRHYLDRDDEREAVAQAGQARTLREHTYAQRMRELAAIVRKYL